MIPDAIGAATRDATTCDTDDAIPGHPSPLVLSHGDGSLPEPTIE
jgi:hypothetical protein